MSTIPVSVVIPLYNKARHIKRALNSVLAQAHREFEVIVVNDGSTDRSEEVVKACSDPRVRLISQENAGVSAARNRGIAEARAELIAFLDADDQWLPGHLKTILRLRQRFPDCGAYATAYCYMDGATSFRGIPTSPWEGVVNFFHSDPLTSSTVAVPRRVFDTVGRFKPGIIYCEDTDMWCRIALEFPVAFSTRIGAIIHKAAENRTTPSFRHDRYFLFSIRDIKDWPGLLSSLCQAGKSADLSPGKRIWNLLSEDTRGLVERMAADSSLQMQHKTLIISALNTDILGRRNLYEADYFSGISIPEEARSRLADIVTLSDSDVLKLNRRLLELACPDLIVKRVHCREWQPARTLAGVLSSRHLRPGVSKEDIAGFMHMHLRCPGLGRRTNSQS